MDKNKLLPRIVAEYVNENRGGRCTVRIDKKFLSKHKCTYADIYDAMPTLRDDLCEMGLASYRTAIDIHFSYYDKGLTGSDGAPYYIDISFTPAKSRYAYGNYDSYYHTHHKERDISIYNALMEGYKPSDIGELCGVDKARILGIKVHIAYVIEEHGWEHAEDADICFTEAQLKGRRKYSDWYGTYNKWKHLDILNSFNKGVSIADLAKSMGLSKGAISNILAKMRNIVNKYGYESKEDELYSPSAKKLPKRGYKKCRAR